MGFKQNRNKLFSFLISFIVNIHAFLTSVHSVHVLVRRGDSDWTNITEGTLFVTTNESYYLFCSGKGPVMWNTTATLDSYRIENAIEWGTGVYSNQLVVRFTLNGTGNYSCNEKNGKHTETEAQSVEIQVFVNGSTEFIGTGGIIDLNTQGVIPNVIPCKTSNPIMLPTLSQNGRSQLIDAPFQPTVGFQLDKPLTLKDSYQCCLGRKCIKYRVEGKSFTAYPSSTILYPLKNAELLLKCQADSTLNFTIIPNNHSTNQLTISPIKMLFNGGPVQQALLQITNLTGVTQVECKDSRNFKKWTVIPLESADHTGNRSLEFLTHRSAFVCKNDDTKLNVRNLFCESENNCQLKSKCFEEETCPAFIKTSTPCDDTGCRSLRDPFNTGVIECTNGYTAIRKYYFTGLNRQKYFVQEDEVPIRAIVKIEEFKSPYYRGLNKPLIVFCQHTLFTLARGAFFQVKFKNGTIRSFDETGQMLKTRDEEEQGTKRLLRDVLALSVKFEPTSDMIEVLCTVPESGSNKFLTDSRELTVIDAMKPTIWNSEVQKVLYLDDDLPQHILCNVSGQPIPSAHWIKKSPDNSNNITTIVSSSNLLTFNHLNESTSGVYYCIATNPLGNDTLMLEISVKPPSRLIWILVPGLILLVLIILWLLMIYRRRTIQLREYLNKISEKEIEEFFKGNVKLLGQEITQSSATDIATLMPYNSLFEIPESSLRYSFSDLIGKGEYGIVYKGTLNEDKTVAIKTVVQSQSKKSFAALLTEIKVMIYVGYHPCIVEFIGAVTKNVQLMEAFAIVEYCDNRDLHSFLHSLQISDSQRIAGYSDLSRNYLNSPSSLVPMMIEWCYQICSGVEHLGKRKIVHGDIATRNILLANKLRAKIGDFGLSCKVSDYKDYVTMGQSNPLPWRWLALESLQGFKFSRASDVWAVGVTIWEIFSVGNKPFPEMSWNNEFVDKLSSGLRLLRPELCSTEIYEQMLRTWNKKPDARISITELKIYFEGLLSSN